MAFILVWIMIKETSEESKGFLSTDSIEGFYEGYSPRTHNIELWIIGKSGITYRSATDKQTFLDLIDA